MSSCMFILSIRRLHPISPRLVTRLDIFDIQCIRSSSSLQPWPIIEQFISSLPVGSIGLDSGTGNGKYLPLPSNRPMDIITIGLDRSRDLLQIAQRAGNRYQEVVLGDALDNYWRPGIFVRQPIYASYLFSFQSIIGLRYLDSDHTSFFNSRSAPGGNSGKLVIDWLPMRVLEYYNSPCCKPSRLLVVEF